MMELRSPCCGFQVPTIMRLSPNQYLFHHKTLAAPLSAGRDASRSHEGFRDCRLRFRNKCKSDATSKFMRISQVGLFWSWERGVVVCAAKPNGETQLNSSGENSGSGHMKMIGEAEPFHGKSGSVSFHGLTHQMVEEAKLVSAPFKENTGSFLWALAPVAFISSLVLPQYFLSSAVEAFIKDEILSEIVISFSSEVTFYVGLATFLLITDSVQKPYLQFSPKRWGLITGLRGYLSSAFFVMGFKVIAPLFAVYVTWPVLGLPALVAVAPFLAGCLVQYLFEARLDKRGSSCWPLVPIIFEVYRLYQLSKAAHFIERLMFAMKGVRLTPEVLERNGALVAMIITFQVVGMVCLWSLLTFLMRLFPSRPVAEKY